MEVTRDSIINSLKVDPKFSLGFAIDNNYPEIQSATFKTFGVLLKSHQDLFNYLWQKLSTAEANKVIDIVKATPYRNEAPTGAVARVMPEINKPYAYTLGFEDYFASLTPVTGFKTLLNSLLTGLGAGLSAYADSQATAGATGGVSGATSGLTQAEIEAIKEAEEKRKAEEEAAKKRKTIIIVSAVAGSLILIGVIIYFVRKNKK